MVKKKATQQKIVSQRPVRTFERWLVAGLTTIFIYVVTSLIVALYAQSENVIADDASFLITTLTYLLYAAGIWWLIESARWIVIMIDRQSVSASKKPTPKKK